MRELSGGPLVALPTIPIVHFTSDVIVLYPAIDVLSGRWRDYVTSDVLLSRHCAGTRQSDINSLHFLISSVYSTRLSPRGLSVRLIIHVSTYTLSAVLSLLNWLVVPLMLFLIFFRSSLYGHPMLGGLYYTPLAYWVPPVFTLLVPGSLSMIISVTIANKRRTPASVLVTP